MMTATTIDFDTKLIDEFFASIQYITPDPPRQIAPPRPGPYHVTPPHMIERQQIEAQLRSLVEASTAHLYELLQERFDKIHAAQDELIRLEQQRLAEQRNWQENQDRQKRLVSGLCAASRQDFYS